MMGGEVMYVPTKVFFTKGVGSHRDELRSFELALKDAGIERLNLVHVSSIYPPQCKIITKEEGTKLIAPGSIAFCVMARQASNEKDLRVHVSYGAGEFSVRPAEKGLLYRMQLRYDEDVFEPHADYEGTRLRLGVENRGKSIHLGKNRSGGEMDLQLARGVPMDLDLEFGAVRADLDLGGLSLTRLELSTGASESTVAP